MILSERINLVWMRIMILLTLVIAISRSKTRASLLLWIVVVYSLHHRNSNHEASPEKDYKVLITNSKGTLSKTTSLRRNSIHLGRLLRTKMTMSWLIKAQWPGHLTYLGATSILWLAQIWVSLTLLMKQLTWDHLALLSQGLTIELKSITNNFLEASHQEKEKVLNLIMNSKDQELQVTWLI